MTTLYYIHDPMCSWCWGFSATLRDLLEALPTEVQVKRLLGGLAADSQQPMPAEMQQSLRETWQRIEQEIPGVHFNFDFWSQCQPRRSTYPACRAVIAARAQGAEYDLAMTQAIQRAYYQEARNPADESTLITLANEIGLDQESFTQTLRSPNTQSQLMAEIQQAHRMGITSFPSLLLRQEQRFDNIAIDYHDYRTMLQSIHRYRQS